jgi:hypothetical protein
LERIADAQRLHAPPALGEEAFGRALLDQQARTDAAGLTLVQSDRVGHALYRAVQIGVLEYDERRTAAAEFQREFLACPSGGRADQPTDFGGAG